MYISLKYLDDQLNNKKISMSPDVIAVIDTANLKVLKFFDVVSGKAHTNTVEHSNEIIEFELNSCELGSERKIAFLDNNRDLFITPVLRKDIVFSWLTTEKNYYHVRLLPMAC